MYHCRLVLLAAATLLAGCAKEFPVEPYSAEEQAFRATLADDPSFDARLALARMAFEHNQIDAAEALLTALVAEDPGHMEALAWHGANRCKLAGRRPPWLLGLDKLYLVKRCLDQVQAAAAGAPDDLTVQLVLINTGAEVQLFGSLEKAGEALARLQRALAERPADFTPSAHAWVLLAAARVAEARGELEAARDYRQRVMAMNADAATVALARRGLAATP